MVDVDLVRPDATVTFVLVPLATAVSTRKGDIGKVDRVAGHEACDGVAVQMGGGVFEDVGPAGETLQRVGSGAAGQRLIGSAVQEVAPTSRSRCSEGRHPLSRHQG